MKSPCKRIDPRTGQIVEIIKGRAFEPNPAQFARRVGQADLSRGAVLDSVSIETLEQLSDLHRLADDVSPRKA